MLRRLTPIVAALIFVIHGSAFAAGGGGDGGGGGGGGTLDSASPNTFNNNQFQQRRGQQAQPNDPFSGEQAKAKKKKRQDNRSEWRDLYRLAVNQVQEGRYETAITTFVALKEADSPDVENYLGYANRKMGRMVEARIHYENALALNPEHRGALEYFGEWHVEMGKLDEAQRLLLRLAGVCGTNCQEYQALADAIAPKRVH
jgi:tetratricopeptide (TPR) repeat protein